MSEGRTREALERSASGARVLSEHGLAHGPLLARLLALEARAVTQHSDHAGAARLLARAKAGLERDRDPALYARLEVDEANAWVLSLDRTLYDAARSRLEALLPRLVAAGDEAGAAHALRALGNLAYYSGDMSTAEDRFREALTRCERLGDLPVAAGLWNNLGLVARMRGELRRAELALERALDIAERLGQGSVICRALTNVGRVRRSLGDLRGAARSLTQAAEVARAVGDPMIESAAWSELGMARLAEGRSRAALAALLRARRLRRALGDPGRVAESELDLAELWRKGGDVRAALASTARALALQASLGNGDGAAVAVEALEFATGRPGGPAALLETARRGPRASGPPPLPEAVRKGEALARLARRTLATALAARAGDVQQARVHALHARRLLRKVRAQSPAPGVLALARALRLEARAVLLAARGRKGEARDLLDRALDDAALPAVRRGALHLKRAFLDLALGDGHRARQDAGKATSAGLSEPLAERRAVGRALIAGGAAQRDGGRDPDDAVAWPEDAPAPALSVAQETARRLGDVALLAMVSTALAEAAAQDSRFDDAASERAAAAAAAGRLSLGLPASLRAGIERAHAPADAGRARPAPRAAPVRPARRAEALEREVEERERPAAAAPPARPPRPQRHDDEDDAEREPAESRGVPGAMAGTQAIIGASPPMRAVHRLIERYGRTTAPVTIHGESGTGKELVASALHRASPRRQGPFVAFNCSAVTDTLLESELFGVIKGAYTGADRDRKGLFELAHGGTLFMDEVGDMSLDMQAKLLRVLETGELRPVGGRQVVKVDVRIISASHHDLRALSQQGRMREDLFYRLNVLRIELPPLRERREDLPLLIDHFLAQVARDRGEPRRRLSPEALDVLMRHPFPGNVRELRNVLDRACVLETGDVVTATRLLVDAAPPIGPAATAAQAKLPAYQRTYAYQGVALNRRQRQVLDYLAQGAAAVTNREFCAMADVSERTGLRDLSELVEQGILTRLGKRKGARYQLSGPVA
jgi:DNA-binding NtrC family response regulator/tetratricopeptide (TPR) repeat protein